MSWTHAISHAYKKVGVQWGQPKDLWQGRGFQKNSAYSYIGALYAGYGALAGGGGAATVGGTAAGGGAGAQSVSGAASTTADATSASYLKQTANSQSRNRAIGQAEYYGHNAAGDYIADPYKSSGPIAMPGEPANDPNVLASAQAGQQAALLRQRRQRVVAAFAGANANAAGLGQVPLNGGAKSLLGA